MVTDFFINVEIAQGNRLDVRIFHHGGAYNTMV
jgi:hypothetical protein